MFLPNAIFFSVQFFSPLVVSLVCLLLFFWWIIFNYFCVFQLSQRGGTASSERWRRTSGRVTHRGETTRFFRLDFGSWLAKFLYHADSLATLAKKIKLEQCVYTCDGVVDRFRTDWLSFLWLWTLIVPFWSCLRRHFTLDLFTPLVCASSWLENFCEFILSLLSSHGTNKSMQQLNNCEFRTQLFLSFFIDYESASMFSGPNSNNFTIAYKLLFARERLDDAMTSRKRQMSSQGEGERARNVQNSSRAWASNLY